MALLAKQLSPTKRRLLLIENVPQAGMAVIYLAVEGGSLLVALLNLAIPAGQVLASICLHRPLQKRLARWYAQRLDASLEDADAVLGRRICGEISIGFAPHVAKHSRFLGAILHARARVLSDLGVVVAEDMDKLGTELSWQCVFSHFDGAISVCRGNLAGQAEVLNALLDFAFRAAWVEGLEFERVSLTAEDVATVTTAMTMRPHRRRLAKLVFQDNSFGDAGAAVIARALPRLHLEKLMLDKNEISDIECTGLRELFFPTGLESRRGVPCVRPAKITASACNGSRRPPVAGIGATKVAAESGCPRGRQCHEACISFHWDY